MVFGFLLACFSFSRRPKPTPTPIERAIAKEVQYVKTSYNKCWQFDGEFTLVSIKYCQIKGTKND